MPRALKNKDLKKLNKLQWIAVGCHIENDDDEFPELIVECLDSDRAYAIANEIANRLNSYGDMIHI